MLERYLFNEEEPRPVMLDYQRQEVVYYNPTDQHPFRVASVNQHLLLMLGQLFLVGVVLVTARQYFNSTLPIFAGLLFVSFVFTEQVLSGAAVVWYGLLKRVPSTSPPTTLVALGLGLGLWLMDIRYIFAQYDPPDSVGAPADIGAQMDNILTWAPVEWYIGMMFACAGLALAIGTVKRGLSS